MDGSNQNGIPPCREALTASADDDHPLPARVSTHAPGRHTPTCVGGGNGGLPDRRGTRRHVRCRVTVSCRQNPPRGGRRVGGPHRPRGEEEAGEGTRLVHGQQPRSKEATAMRQAAHKTRAGNLPAPRLKPRRPLAHPSGGRKSRCARHPPSPRHPSPRTAAAAALAMWGKQTDSWCRGGDGAY